MENARAPGHQRWPIVGIFLAMYVLIAYNDFYIATDVDLVKTKSNKEKNKKSDGSADAAWRVRSDLGSELW